MVRQNDEIKCTSSEVVELFRLLYTAYEMTKGYVRHPMMLQQLAAVLGYDMNDNPKYQDLIELFTHLQKEYLLRYESSLGTVFTISGLDEIETSLLEPEKPTRYFPSNVRRFVQVNESLMEFIRKIKKARKDFLYCTFEEANGFETSVVSPFQIKEKLALEDDVFSSVFYYLLDADYINSRHSNGISITHKTKVEMAGETIEDTEDSFWHSPTPDITISDDIVHILDKINSAATAKFGFEIFYNKAGPIRELRLSIRNLNNDSKNKATFVTCLLSIATILGEVNIKEIQKHVTTSENKSIKIIEELFNTKGVTYNELDFTMLRNVIRLRSTIPPVHSGTETEFSQALRFVGIEYPIVDWAEAADTCLKQLLNALIGLERSLVSS